MKQYRKWIKLLITNPEWMFPYLVEKMSGGVFGWMMSHMSG